MGKRFIDKVPTIKKWSRIVLLPSVVILLILKIIGICDVLIISLLLLVVYLGIECLWVVPTGNIGYVEVLQKIKDKTYKPGLNWYIPFITDRYLMDTRVVEIARIDRKKIILGTDIIFQENFNYRLRQDMVHKVFQILGSDYWSTVEKWIDSVIDGVTSRFTYAEIRADQEGFKQVLIKIVQSKVEERCREMTASLVTKEELVTLYELGIIYEEIVDPKNPTISVPDPDNPGAMIDKPNYIKVPKMIAVEEEGITEYVPAKGCIEVKKTLKGINFFELMTLTINDIKYPEDYQNARNNLVNKKIEAAIAKEEAKKMETLAEGRKKQLILEAEGTATAIRLKGEAENEVLSKRGEVLNSNPDLISEEVAKNYPKVVGGALPTLSVDSIVDNKK